jgi:hypothetical protein
MTTSTTNILSLPLAQATIVTGTNEDWIDSFVYIADDGTANPPQIDLHGIRFEMEIRRAADDSEVILQASTDNQSLAYGVAPDVGYLFINISHDSMVTREPGIYVGEIVAMDAFYQRRTILIDLTIVEGIAR